MIYWTPNSVPELKGLDKSEQKRLFKECGKEGRKRMGTQFWILFALYLLLVVVIFLLWPLGGIIGGLLLGLIIGFAAVLVLQTPMINAGRAWLREQGYPKA